MTPELCRALARHNRWMNENHRELWNRDPDGYTVVLASPDGDAKETQTLPE